MLLIAAVLLMSCGQATTSADAPAAKPLLVIESWVSTAGPYGESWDSKLAPSGEASLQVFYTAASGSLMGQFRLSDERLAKLRATLDRERFFDLPKEIAPKTAPLHQPDLRLGIWLDGRRHHVSLYDPGQLTKDESARRFLAVWSALYAGVPLKPTW